MLSSTRLVVLVVVQQLQQQWEVVTRCRRCCRAPRPLARRW
jgi:hypothetical protein